MSEGQRKGKFARQINATTIVCYSSPHSCPGFTLTVPIVTIPEILAITQPSHVKSHTYLPPPPDREITPNLT